MRSSGRSSRRQHLALHPATQRRRLGEPRMEVADEVDRPAHGARQRHPAIAALAESRRAARCARRRPSRAARACAPAARSPRPSRDARDRRATSSSSRSSGGTRDRPARTAAAADASRSSRRRVASPCGRSPATAPAARAGVRQRPADRAADSELREPARGRGAAAVASITSTNFPAAGVSSPCGRTNASTNARDFAASCSPRTTRASWARCSSIDAATCSSPPLAFLQMLEVQRAFLLPGELGRQHREHRTADDARLDQRAGVDADHRDAVEHRVVVVGARVGVDRVGAGARPDADAPRTPTDRSPPTARHSADADGSESRRGAARGSAAWRTASIQRRTKPTSYGVMNGDEQRYSSSGRSGGHADLQAELLARASTAAARTSDRRPARR